MKACSALLALLVNIGKIVAKKTAGYERRQKIKLRR
jgi:hypothetical protein